MPLDRVWCLLGADGASATTSSTLQAVCCCCTVCAPQVLGVPTPEIWPGYADLPHRIDFKPAPGQPLQQVFKQVGPWG